MKLDISKQLSRPNTLVARALLRLLTRSLNPYQPVLLDGKTIHPGRRDCEARVAAILQTLAGTKDQTILDLGSAEGYFVRRCAEAGYLTVGVEADIRRLVVAQWSLALDGVTNFGFIRAHIDRATLTRLPPRDVTLSLSLFHHVIYEHGVGRARSLLEAIRQRTNHVLIFEMGQSDETEFEWAQLLPDMTPNPHEWIADFIASAGFSDVKKICESSAYNSDVQRATFAART